MKITKKKAQPMKKSKPAKKIIKKKLAAINSLPNSIIEDKNDKYKEHACEFLNEAECEEELEDDGLDLDDVEREHFEEEKV